MSKPKKVEIKPKIKGNISVTKNKKRQKGEVI